MVKKLDCQIPVRVDCTRTLVERGDCCHAALLTLAGTPHPAAMLERGATPVNGRLPTDDESKAMTAFSRSGQSA